MIAPADRSAPKVNYPGTAAFWVVVALGFTMIAAGPATGPRRVLGQTPYQSSADFARFATQLRASGVFMAEPRAVVAGDAAPLGFLDKYPWKTGIVTTVFWVGETPSENNRIHNMSSSWDQHWQESYGGYDDPNPAARRGFMPVSFVPRQNPFYCALPYNDVTCGTTKLESREVIPWFQESFTGEGKSVCKGRWVAIRNGAGKVCFAQWSDCGPYRTDDWQYVFGKDRPKANVNHDSGLDVSPAVRDYLGLAGTDVTDWRFADFHEVLEGPWRNFGDEGIVSGAAGRAQGFR